METSVNNKCKAFTSLEQSKKLAEILPLESADMYYACGAIAPDIMLGSKQDYRCYTMCWSLAALLEILDYPQLSKDKLGSGKEGWMVSVYPDNCRYDSCWHENPVDACYEMILKLHELKML